MSERNKDILGPEGQIPDARPKGILQVREKRGGGVAGPTHSQEQADTIQELSSKKNQTREDRIDWLREQAIPTKEQFKDVEKRLEKASPIQWLDTYLPIKSIKSADVGIYYEELAANPALVKDPIWLAEKTIRLVYATGSADKDTREQVNAVVRAVREQIALNPNGSVTVDNFDRMFFGGPLHESSNIGTFKKGQKKDKLFEECQKQEDITDPELIAILLSSNYDTRVGVQYTEDKYDALIEKISNLGMSRKVPDKQIREAIDRVKKQKNILSGELTRQRIMDRSGVEDWSILTDKQKDRMLSQPLDVRGFSLEEQRLLFESESKGVDLLHHWFSDFLVGLYGFDKEAHRPDIPDLQKFERFKEIIRWVHPEQADRLIPTFDMLFKDRGRHEGILKALSYKPGKTEDKLMFFRQLLGADFDFYTKLNKYASITIGLYGDELSSFLAAGQDRYNESLAFVKSSIDREKIPEWIQQRMGVDKIPLASGHKKVQDITNDQLYFKYKEASDKHLLDVEPGMSQAQKDELERFKNRMEREFRKHIDTVGFGVQLLDEDVLTHSEVVIEINTALTRRDELSHKGRTLTQDEQIEYDNLDRFIHKKEEVRSKLERRGKTDEKGQESENARRRQEFSPLEVAVYDRLVKYLRVEKAGMPPEEFDTFLSENHWKLRDAVWAARMHMIGSGHMVDLGSWQVTRPKNVILESFKYTDGGRYTMISPFMEDIQRLINPLLFQHRFEIGGAVGKRVAAILQSGIKGGDFSLITTTKEWLEDEGEVVDQETKAMRRKMEYAEQVMGISFTELLGIDFLHGGMSFDGSAWRLDEGLLQAINQSYLESGLSSESWENAALGIQLITQATVEGRTRILQKMIKRNPLVFAQLMAGKKMNEIYAKYGVSKEDQYLFRDVLSDAQTKITYDDALAIRGDIDLGGGDFDLIVAPYLSEKSPEEQQRLKILFKNMTLDVQKEAQKVIPEWAKGHLPITLVFSGINWEKSHFAKLGTAAFDRRGRDNFAMGETSRILLTQIFDLGVLGPDKLEDMLKVLKEFETAAGTYMPRSQAEAATQKVLRMIILFNENRATRTAIGWIPGLTTLLKSIGQLEIGHFPILHGIGEIKKSIDHKPNFLEEWAKDAGVSGKKIISLPKTVSEWISLSVGYQGSRGNAWDEFKIATLLDLVERQGLFQTDPKLLGELRREFRATIGGKLLAIPRKYWWIVPLATITVAAMDAVNDEKKK